MCNIKVLTLQLTINCKISKIYYCEFIIIRGILIFVDFVYIAKPRIWEFNEYLCPLIYVLTKAVDPWIYNFSSNHGNWYPQIEMNLQYLKTTILTEAYKWFLYNISNLSDKWLLNNIAQLPPPEIIVWNILYICCIFMICISLVLLLILQRNNVIIAILRPSSLHKYNRLC